MFTFSVRPAHMSTPDACEALGSRKGAPAVFLSATCDELVRGARVMIAACQSAGIAAHPVLIRGLPAGGIHEPLGVPLSQIHSLGFSGSLARQCGRWEEGHGRGQGLLTSMVQLLRKLRPEFVFLPSECDPDPDFKIVWRQGLWSVFVSWSDYWPELGPAAPEPRVFEYLVNSRLSGDPTLRVESGDRVEYYREFVRIKGEPAGYHKLFEW